MGVNVFLIFPYSKIGNLYIYYNSNSYTVVMKKEIIKTVSYKKYSYKYYLNKYGSREEKYLLITTSITGLICWTLKHT